MSLFLQASLGKGSGWWTGTDRMVDTKRVSERQREREREGGKEMEKEGIIYAGKGRLFNCLQPTDESNKP